MCDTYKTSSIIQVLIQVLFERHDSVHCQNSLQNNDTLYLFKKSKDVKRIVDWWIVEQWRLIKYKHNTGVGCCSRVEDNKSFPKPGVILKIFRTLFTPG